MKHYLYRSGPKLRDLYSQTGSKLGDLVGNIEWRINLGDVAEIKRSPKAINEHYMMKAVVRALEKAGKVGTITNPKDYVKGIMPMKWGLYAGGVIDEAPDGPLVYFGGLDVDKRKLVALGGSSNNVVGHEGATSTTSLSVTQSIVAALRHGFETGSLKDTHWQQNENWIYQGMAIAQSHLRPPVQQLEFLAKTLLVGEAIGVNDHIGVDHVDAILCTPLYVALVAPDLPLKE